MDAFYLAAARLGLTTPAPAPTTCGGADVATRSPVREETPAPPHPHEAR
jgi:hypothetical protein